VNAALKELIWHKRTPSDTVCDDITHNIWCDTITRNFLRYALTFNLAHFQELALNTKDGLQPLTAEATVFGEVASTAACKVPEAMVSAWRAARQAANDLVEQHEAKDGKHQCDVLGKKEKMLEQIDRSFRIELGYIESLANSGGAMISATAECSHGCLLSQLSALMYFCSHSSVLSQLSALSQMSAVTAQCSHSSVLSQLSALIVRQALLLWRRRPWPACPQLRPRATSRWCLPNWLLSARARSSTSCRLLDVATSRQRACR